MQTRSDYEKCAAIREVLNDPSVFLNGHEYSRREIMSILRKRKTLTLDEEVISLPAILNKMGWQKSKPMGGRGMTWVRALAEAKPLPVDEPLPRTLLDDVKDDTRDIRAIVTDIRHTLIGTNEMRMIDRKRISDIEEQVSKFGKQLALFFEQMGAKV